MITLEWVERSASSILFENRVNHANFENGIHDWVSSFKIKLLTQISSNVFLGRCEEDAYDSPIMTQEMSLWCHVHDYQAYFLGQ